MEYDIYDYFSSSCTCDVVKSVVFCTDVSRLERLSQISRWDHLNFELSEHLTVYFIFFASCEL